MASKMRRISKLFRSGKEQEAVLAKKSPGYVHRPIKSATQIRLLQYSVVPPGEDIALVIATFDLYEDSCPVYATVSYEWMSGVRNMRISLDDEEFCITENLHDFLRSLPREQAPYDPQIDVGGMWFWIDAICIDQSNLQERMEQILLMRDIFVRSEGTLAWLGPPSHDSDLAVALMRTIYIKCRGATKSRMFDELLTDPFYWHAWIAINNLFHRGWWRRLWIKQEFALSENLMFTCGSRAFGCDVLHHFMSCIAAAADRRQGSSALIEYRANNLFIHDQGPRYPLLENEGFRETIEACDIHKLSWLYNLRLPLQSLLYMTKDSQCTDPRDRIYGLLGLAADADFLKLEPDYTVAVQKVYARLIVAHVQVYKTLDMICYSTSRGTLRELPSWVPDWTGQSSRGHDLSSMFAYNQLDTACRQLGIEEVDFATDPFHASKGDGMVTAFFTADLTYLSTNGVLIGTVDSLAWASASDEEVEMIQGSSNFEPLTPSCFGSELRDEFARTLLCDRYEFRVPEPAFISSSIDELCSRWLHGIHDNEIFQKWYENNGALFIRGCSLDTWMREWVAILPFPSQQAVLSEQCSAYVREAGQTMIYRRKRLMITADGRLGMAPFNSQREDQVWVLFGCSMPVVLRQHEEHFELIGECYVDGMMDGEAMAELKEGKREEELITLR